MKIIDKLACPIDYDCRFCKKAISVDWGLYHCTKDYGSEGNPRFKSKISVYNFPRQRYKRKKFILCEFFENKS